MISFDEPNSRTKGVPREQDGVRGKRPPREGASTAGPRPQKSQPKDGYQIDPAGLRDRRPGGSISKKAYAEFLERRYDTSRPPPHLITLADLSPDQISFLLRSAIVFKTICKGESPLSVYQSLGGRTVAMMFSKRSTRTRVASETATGLLGGRSLFLGSQDIQLGVNETLQDTAKVVGSMVDGFMARVGEHSEIEVRFQCASWRSVNLPPFADCPLQELVKYSPVPVINALSKLYHPTQILADLMALYEAYSPDTVSSIRTTDGRQSSLFAAMQKVDVLAPLKGKKVAWVGDTNNITNELLVTLPRLGMELAVASPKGYDQVDEAVWARV